MFVVGTPIAAPEGWLMVFKSKPAKGEANPFSSSNGYAAAMHGVGAFCTWECLRDYTIAKTLVDEPTADS
jgi:hypothetical protein